MTAPALADAVREAEDVVEHYQDQDCPCDRNTDCMASSVRALMSLLAAVKAQPPAPPAPAIPEAVREAAERTDKAMRDVFGGVDQYGDYCGLPMIPVKLANCVQALLAALSPSRPPDSGAARGETGEEGKP